jgi:phenylpropionate dioxygenase-like ring-hydroxylating dioxygenase large terminal subunit
VEWGGGQTNQKWPSGSLRVSLSVVQRQRVPWSVVSRGSLPLQVAQGLLFVWPDASPEGLAEAEVTPPPLFSELDDIEYSDKGTTMTRDLPYDHITFLENLMVRV